MLVAVVNQSTVETDAQVQARLGALDDQNNLDLAPVWQVPQTKRILVPSATPLVLPAGTERLELILDNATQAGALGYHSDSDQEVLPTSYIFSKTTLDDGASPSVVHSHEACETAVDPYISYTVMLDNQIGGFRGGYTAIVMLEVSDGPEADQFGYKRNGILLSNFVTPAWFGMPWTIPVDSASKQFDFIGNVSQAFGLDRRGKPIGINPGGYIALRLMRVAKDWYQVNAQLAPALEAIENAVPSDGPKVLRGDGTLMDHATICPFTRRHRWLKRHGGV